jgi:DNA repair exonuclease SbcCD ATPase subunit
MYFAHGDDDADTQMEEHKESSVHEPATATNFDGAGVPSAALHRMGASVSSSSAAAAAAAAASPSASAFRGPIAQLMKQHCDAIELQRTEYEQQAATKEEAHSATKQQLADALAAVERYKTIKEEKLDAAQGASHQAKTAVEQAKKVFALSEQTEAAVTKAQKERDAALKAEEDAVAEAQRERGAKRKAQQALEAEVKKRQILEAQLASEADERVRLAAELAAVQAQLRQLLPHR